jgi:hypothetical protein
MLHNIAEERRSHLHRGGNHGYRLFPRLRKCNVSPYVVLKEWGYYIFTVYKKM